MVTLSGRDYYLGPWRTQVSRDEYDRVVREWLANGRRAPVAEGEREGVYVAELVAAFWRHAQEYYRKDGKPTNELSHFKTVAKVLNRMYGRTPVVEFGPLALKACRQGFIDNGQARRTVNQNTGRVKRIFRWGVENELVPGSVFHGLQAVGGLLRGRCSAPEGRRVEPVPEDVVEATLAHVSAAVGAMIRLQLLTGMRPGEVVAMRGCEVDRSKRPWTYQPRTHKTAHLEHERVVYLGPQAQAVLSPFLGDGREGYLFSAAEAEEARNAARTLGGPTARGSRGRKGDRRRPWGERYGVDSYRRAIQRACVKADVASWHPHQLRHTAATKLRRVYGIEVTRVILGHRSAAVTEIYAETDRAKACEVMAQVG